MFIAALLITTKNTKKNHLMGEWLNNLWYIHILECCSEIQRNKLVIHVINLMNFKVTKKKPI